MSPSSPVNPKPWVDHLVEVAVGLVVAALLLRWAWDLLSPLVPILLVVAIGALIARALVRRHRDW
jgi:hypothetical protein